MLLLYSLSISVAVSRLDEKYLGWAVVLLVGQPGLSSGFEQVCSSRGKYCCCVAAIEATRSERCNHRPQSFWYPNVTSLSIAQPLSNQAKAREVSRSV